MDELLDAEMPALAPPVPLILRWDLDKTYLATNFESFRAMMRIPFEGPEDKHSLPGVRSLIRSLQEEAREANQPVETYFITASPPQIRRPIEEKLRQDGIEVDDIVYKDQMRDLLRGRFRSLKQHVGYKLRSLLQHRRDRAPANARELLFGDDWEADPLVYTLYSDLLAGEVEDEVARAVLKLVGVEPPKAARLLELARECQADASVVERIFIHHARPRSSTEDLLKYGGRLVATDNYLQTAAVLHASGQLSVGGVVTVARELVQDHGWNPELVGSTVRRLQTRGVELRADWAELALRVQAAFDPNVPVGLPPSAEVDADPDPTALGDAPGALVPRTHRSRRNRMRRRAAAWLDYSALWLARRRLGWVEIDPETPPALSHPDYYAILLDLINGTRELEPESEAPDRGVPEEE